MARRRSIRCLTFVRAETGILEKRISMGGLVLYHRAISFRRSECMTVKTRSRWGQNRRGLRLRRGMNTTVGLLTRPIRGDSAVAVIVFR